MKKQIKILVCVLALILLSVSALAGCGEKPWYDPDLPIGNLVVPEYKDDVQMFIGGFWGPSYTLGWGNQAAFDDSAEQGITVLIPIPPNNVEFGANPTAAREYMNMAKAAKLKVLVTDTSLGVPWNGNPGQDVFSSQWDTTQAEWYTQHEAFAGVNFMDEPRYIHFKPLAEKYGKWREEFPGKPIFTNLLGMSVSGADAGGSAQIYLDTFMEMKPDMLSFTDYPLKDDGTVNLGTVKETAMARAAAKQAGISAHKYILSAGHGGPPGSGVHNKHNLTVEEMRWQVSLIQAYGYSAFSHYAVDLGSVAKAFPPPYPYTDDPWFTNGQRNDLWYNVQAVNLEALAWDHVYLRFAPGWKGTAPITGSHGKTNLMLAIVDDGRLKVDEISGVKSVTSTQDILFGVFEDDNKNKGFMVTNVTNPMDMISGSVTVRFETGKNGYNGVQIWEKGVPRAELLDKDGCISIDLEPGEGKFLIPLVKR